MRFIARIEGFPGWSTFNEAHPELWTVEQDIEKRLGGFDGSTESYYILVMLPNGVDIDTMNETLDTGKNFLQCAGQVDRLTIEHVHPRDEMLLHHADLDNVRDILGQHEPDTTREPRERIPMSGGREQTVHPEEVFTLQDAATIFAHYYRHGAPPPHLHRRTVKV